MNVVVDVVTYVYIESSRGKGKYKKDKSVIINYLDEQLEIELLVNGIEEVFMVIDSRNKV